MANTLAVQFIGYDIVGSAEQTFRYSNNGVTDSIDEAGEHYYPPYITNSILIKQVAGSLQNDAVSVELSNDRTLDDLVNYSFEGYSMKVYMELSGSYKLLWVGKIEKLSLGTTKITVKGKSNFDILENLVNPATFTGDLDADPYDGDAEIINKNKPRLFGQVFNIRPVLLNPSKLIYGFNWGKDGERVSLSGTIQIRDGGLPLFDSGTHLTRSESKFLNGENEYGDITTIPMSRDFPTTLAMDEYLPAPQAGSYYTCFAESTFKLGSVPVFDITLDVKSSFVYGDWIRIVCEENELFGYSIHRSPDYAIGCYFEHSADYKQVNEYLAENLDIHLWFDGDAALNVTRVEDDGSTPAVHFIEAGIDFQDLTSVPFSQIIKKTYEKPYHSLSLHYQQNYTIQMQSVLAGKATEENDAVSLYEPKSLTVSKEKDWGDVYPIEHTDEMTCAIGETEDAQKEVDRIFDRYGTPNYGLDYFTLTCYLLEDVNNLILGVIPGGVSEQVDFSSTSVDTETAVYTMDNDNGIFAGALKTLLIGDPVYLTSNTFSYDKVRGIVDSFTIDSKNMKVTYVIEIPRLVS